MPFILVRNDITRMQTDAVVNAANSALEQGGGVCGAIFAAAGEAPLRDACAAIGHCAVGSAVVTPGFLLPARWIIHAVGPIWKGGGQHEAALLQGCYTRALELAAAHGCESVAFPLISSGVFGYPKAEALRVASDTITAFLRQHDMRVYLTVYGHGELLLGEELAGRIQTYIDDHYVEQHPFPRWANESAIHGLQAREQAELFAMPCCPAAAEPESVCGSPCAAPQPAPAKTPPRGRRLRELFRRPPETFSAMLLRLIDEKGMSDVEIYRRANIDRKLFSKIRKPDYLPSKPTVLALAVALRLNLDETKDLMGRAGYALSSALRFDVIVAFFIEEENYDIFAINEALFAYDQRLLGA